MFLIGYNHVECRWSEYRWAPLSDNNHHLRCFVHLNVLHGFHCGLFSQYENSENARGTCERGLYSTSAQHLARQCQHRSVQERRHQRLRGRRRPPLRTVHALTARPLLGHCNAKLSHWARSLFARGQGTCSRMAQSTKRITAVRLAESGGCFVVAVWLFFDCTKADHGRTKTNHGKQRHGEVRRNRRNSF